MKPSAWLTPDDATAEYMLRRIIVERPSVATRIFQQHQRASPRLLGNLACEVCHTLMVGVCLTRRYCSRHCQNAAKRARRREARQAGYAAIRRGR